MKKSIVIFVLSLVIGFFQSCGPMPPYNTSPEPSDPAFYNYVSEFEHYHGKSTTQIPLYFADLREGTAGICHYFRIGSGPIRWGYIQIDRDYWNVISELQKINLIFHELGHCVLGRDHVEMGNSVLACPTSIMHDTVLTTQCMEDNYQSYLREMFPDFPWGEDGK